MATEVMPGHWQGEYIDAYGHRANLELQLETEGRSVSGRFSLRLRAEDEPVLVTGELEGEIGEEQGTLGMRLDAVDERFTNEVHLRDASSHAHQALFGVATSTGESGLGGGVWIVWRYDQPLRGFETG